MPTDPVIAALTAALAGGESHALHKAIADRYVAIHQLPDALTHYEAGLALEPTDERTLEAAVMVAAKLNDTSRVDGYRAVLAALQHQSAPASPPAATLYRSDPPAPTSLPVRLVAADGELVNDVERPDLTLADVGGLANVKKELTRRVLRPLRHPKLFERFGRRKAVDGLILYGPPGCGKTYIARALAGEIGARFIEVRVTDVLDMWYGESERKLHELFELARRATPSVLFFDEIDAIGRKRTQLSQGAGRTLVNQLLAELDGASTDNSGVFVLGATNHPWDIDTALRRPGRFEQLVFVPPPDLDARAAILQHALADKPTADCDLLAVAKQTDGLSGADLTALVARATDLAIEDTIARGTELPITMSHLNSARRETKASIQSWLDTARNYATYASEGGAYDDLLTYIRKSR